MDNQYLTLSNLFETISAPARLEILNILGSGEACVCHLEARLGYRQAYISQHLMTLRQAGLIDSRRRGKYVFYSLVKPELLPLIRDAAALTGVELPVIEPVGWQEQCGLGTAQQVIDPSTLEIRGSQS